MDKKILYTILEINYLEYYNRKIEDENVDLIPFDWYLSDDYELKCRILVEAIEKKIKIISTDVYRKEFNEFKY